MGLSHSKIIRMRSLSPISIQEKTYQENNSILSAEISRRLKT